MPRAITRIAVADMPIDIVFVDVHLVGEAADDAASRLSASLQAVPTRHNSSSHRPSSSIRSRPSNSGSWITL